MKNTKTITVTKWSHPSTDQKLILAGNAEDTRAEAEQYFDGEESYMSHEVCEMDEEEFGDLPEFEG